ncbi:MAG: ABC transporter permease [Verrucomicrobiota bacterium]
MQAYLTLARREFAGYFFSISGYVIIAASAFLMGLGFVSMLVNLQGDPTPIPVTELFYMTFYFWVILLLTVPVITMRLFAQEKASGTFETLMTTPVTDLQVVGAKFTAALAFYALMWLPLLGCILLLRRYANDPTGFDPGLVATTFLGIVLLGCLFLSLGCLGSALTRNQMTAAMITMVLCVSLFLLSFLSDHFPLTTWQGQAMSLFALRDQMHDFARGIVDSRAVVIYLSLTGFCLYLTLRVIESRRWR